MRMEDAEVRVVKKDGDDSTDTKYLLTIANDRTITGTEQDADWKRADSGTEFTISMKSGRVTFVGENAGDSLENFRFVQLIK